MKITTPNKDTSTLHETSLVLGAKGKTGQRIVRLLEARGHSVRIGSRSASPGFDWHDQSTWKPVVEGVTAIYIAYYPDLASPGAYEHIGALIELAREHKVRKLVLLSGRGEEEAQRCEKLVLDSGIPSTVVRAAWFNQNFSENFMRDMVLEGTIALPVHGVREPLVDADDIAEVAVAALTEDGHDGEIYEVTGPELLSFDQVAAILSEANGRDIRFQPVSHDHYMAGMKAAQLPAELRDLIDYLFREVLDGRNELLADGVERALSRPPRSFADYARKAAAAGCWNE
ncbi:MAG: NmrA family NAD(P)-binding protein [Verrucomicrobiales bacterium]|nr:NmrA family NAD(P)-binding protein [Verrucomicrobiota bacterium JB025]